MAFNFTVVFLIDRTTLWQEFMIHHAIAIEENCQQNLHIRSNLMCFFCFFHFRTLTLGCLEIGFHVIALHQCFVTCYDLFEQIWLLLNVVSISWTMLMRQCFCARFSNIWTICSGALFIPKTPVKIAWYVPLQSKKTVSRTYTFDRTWRSFFGLGSSGWFHWDDSALISYPYPIYPKEFLRIF